MKTYLFSMTGKNIAATIAALLIAGFGGWFFFFKSDTSGQATLVIVRSTFVQEVSVSGKVVAAQDVNLGFTQSGRIAGVYVDVGQHVAAGATLASIENGDLRAAVAQKQAALDSAQAKLAALKVGTRSEEIAVTQSEVASDEIALAQADQALADSIKSAYRVADDAVHNTLDAFLGNANSNTPQIAFLVSDLQYEITLESGRVTAGATLSMWQSDVMQLTPSAAVQEAMRAQANLSSIIVLMSAANMALNKGITTQSTSQTNINGWITDVAAARKALDGAVSALTTAQTARSAAAAALDKDRKNLALQEAGATGEDIAAQEAAVAAAKADLENTQAQLRKTIIIAPFDGIVTKMEAKEGEIVSPNISEISLISTGVFQIESYVPEVSIAAVRVGDAATTTLDAYGPDAPFSATVIAIDPAETLVNGVSSYKTTMQFSGVDARIRPGMTASVTITTAFIPDTISVPQGAIFQKGGSPFVQLSMNGEISDRAVVLGASSRLGNVEVISGISSGDVVVLNPDTSR